MGRDYVAGIGGQGDNRSDGGVAEMTSHAAWMAAAALAVASITGEVVRYATTILNASHHERAIEPYDGNAR